MKRILLVDNYDSFTYNLVHYLEALDCQVTVCFNDTIPMDSWGRYDAIVLSPGPGLPAESGNLMVFLHQAIGQKPILGVCLGMQALALELGGSLFNQKVVKHGIQETVSTLASPLFHGVGDRVDVGLYHSWGVSKDGSYNVTAISDEGIVMALENENLRCYGVQFHPESIMTPKGKQILQNFLEEVNVVVPAITLE